MAKGDDKEDDVREMRAVVRSSHFHILPPKWETFYDFSLKRKCEECPLFPIPQALSICLSNLVQACFKGPILFWTISQTIGMLTPKYSWARMFLKPMILDHSISLDWPFNSSGSLRDASPITSRLRITASCVFLSEPKASSSTPLTYSYIRSIASKMSSR